MLVTIYTLWSQRNVILLNHRVSSAQVDEEVRNPLDTDKGDGAICCIGRNATFHGTFHGTKDA